MFEKDQTIDFDTSQYINASMIKVVIDTYNRDTSSQTSSESNI